MRLARGEILVLLNADAVPAPNFLRRLVPHYQAGADFVVVQSVVKNRETRWGEHKHAEAQRWAGPDPHWTEGFSCRRSAAAAVGYIPGDFPVPFCRDVSFGRLLKEAGFNKHADMAIEVEHYWPESFREYWGNQVHRGAHAAPAYYYMRRRSLPLAALRQVLKALRTLAAYALVLPKLVEAVGLSRHTRRGWRALPSLFLVQLVDDAATIVGNFKGVGRVMRAEQGRRSAVTGASTRQTRP
jgi:hypothetical protein